jgi:hypothetical protein
MQGESWHAQAHEDSMHALSRCPTTAAAAATSSAIAPQGLRCGMRSLNAMSSSAVCTRRTSSFTAGIARRSAASALRKRFCIIACLSTC